MRAGRFGNPASKMGCSEGRGFGQGRLKDKLGCSAVGWQDNLVHRGSVFVVIGQPSLGMSVC